MLAGLEVRRRWRRVVLLAVLVGFVGVVVLSSVAGARRTSSALSRFNASSRAGDLELFVGEATPSQLREFGHVKNVASFAPLRGGAILFPKAPGLQAIAQALDTRFGAVVDRPRVIAGRLARSSAVDEANIGEALAAQLHIGVGDHLDGESYSLAQVEECLTGGCSQATLPAGPRVRLRIVGIVRRPLDLGDRGAVGGVLVLTPAFNQKYEHSIGSFNGLILRVRARNGSADVGQIAAAARRIFGKSPEFGVQDLAVDTQGAQNAIDVLVVALWAFAGVTALAGLVAITIVLSREISLSATDETTQRALGLTRAQCIAVGGLQALPIALGGALIALVGAAFASRLFPIGVARRAEPDPGLHIDWTVLALGTVAVIGGILLLAFLATARTTRRRGAELVKRGQTARAVDAASRAGVRPVATTGVRMALEPGRGSTTVPVRSAIFGGVFGVLGVVAVFLFASSLDHVVATSGSFGWTWNFAASVDKPSLVAPQTPLAHVQGVAAVAEVRTANLQLDGRPVIVWGFTSLRGTLRSEVVAGRAPRGPDEIALGTSSLDELGKSIGDLVHADGPDGSHSYRIVGRAVFPKLDQAQPLANGATLTGAGFERLVSSTNMNVGSVYAAVRVAPSADPATVEHQVANIAGVERPFGPTVPVEVDRLRQVNWLPVTLAALLSLLALLAVGHALVTSVRRRRRDLAVLKTLGFDRRQIRATIAWQATTLATVGLIIGVPAGIVVGGFVWSQVANGLGIATTPRIPVVALLLTIPAALVAVNLIAFFPARAAARTRPAVALRAE
jgi:ABC-type antimicrobial peptide transport system permease subunit